MAPINVVVPLLLFCVTSPNVIPEPITVATAEPLVKFQEPLYGVAMIPSGVPIVIALAIVCPGEPIKPPPVMDTAPAVPRDAESVPPVIV